MWVPKNIVMCTIYVCIAIAAMIDGALSSEDHVAEPICTNDVCVTSECVMSASWIMENMNSSVDPCDDFYEFTCGRFGKLPTSRDTHTQDTFDAASYNLDWRLNDIIGYIDKAKSAKPFKLVKLLYDNCMNNHQDGWSVDEIESFHNRLKDIFGWPVVVGRLWRTLGMSRSDLLSSLLEVNLQPDMLDGRNLVPWIKQGDRVLDPEILRMGFTNEIVQAYYKYMVDMAVIFGADRGQAETELRDVVLTEIMLANDTVSEAERWIHHRANIRITLREFVDKYPKPHLSVFIYSNVPQAYKLTDDDIIIVPKDFDNVEQVLSRTPHRVLANLIWWLRVESAAGSLSDEARVRMREFDRLMGRSTQPVEKWRKCIGVVRSNLGLSLSAWYQRKFINQKVVSDTNEMATLIQQKIYEIVQEARWLDIDSKRQVLQKVANLSGHVAFRNEYKDDEKLEELYENLELSEGDVEWSIANISAFWSHYANSFLQYPLERDDWILDGNLVSMSGAYSPSSNTYTVSAGLVSSEYYDLDRPKFLNYAELGFMIAHEMSHSLDSNTVFINKNAYIREWWSSETKHKFDERVKCMIDQYGNYTVDEVGLKLRAYHNLDENIADNLGAQAAYRAYLNWVRDNEEEKLLPGLVYTPKQLFWIGIGNTWCTDYQNLKLMNVVLTDEHSPAKFRVNGALANIPEFSNDFGCKLGSKMNPVKKCSVW